MRRESLKAQRSRRKATEAQRKALDRKDRKKGPQRGASSPSHRNASQEPVGGKLLPRRSQRNYRKARRNHRWRRFRNSSFATFVGSGSPVRAVGAPTPHLPSDSLTTRIVLLLQKWACRARNLAQGHCHLSRIV